MKKTSQKSGLFGKISLGIALLIFVIGASCVVRQQTSPTIISIQLVLFCLMITGYALDNNKKFRRWLNPKTAILELQPKLNELEEKLKEVDAMDNKVEGIVKLFKLISPIQDAGGYRQEIERLQKRNRKGRFDKEIEALQILQRHFHNAGRSEYGLNRTTNGEEVTAEKVFLGNVFGLWTKTAAYWMSEKEKLEQDFRPDVSKDPNNPVTSWWMINDYQCGGFIKSHTDGIIEQIAVLKATA